MKDFDKKIIMFVIGFSVGTFLMKKALNRTNFNHPEPIPIEHVLSVQNTEKFNSLQSTHQTNQSFSKFRDDKFTNTSNSSVSQSPSYFTSNISSSSANPTSNTVYNTNRTSPYSSLMTGTSSTEKKL
jgi:hypothetical protein